MGTSGSTPGVDRQDVRAVFARLEESTTPLTTTEVSGELDCDDQTADQYLSDLVERGEVESKRVGDSHRIWWWSEDRETSPPGDAADDVHENERERELRRTERRFEAVFEDPNILVGLLDPDGTVLDINETAMEYIDADLGDVRSEPFWETPWWGTGDGVQDDVREWTERAADGEYVDFEADLTDPDGERYVLSGYFRPVTDDDGEVVSIIVSDRDVTERKERERQLRERERSLQRYREYTDDVLDAVDDIFYLLDDSGALQRWNESLHEVTGYAEDEVASANVVEFFDGDGRETIADAVAEGFQTGSVQVEADVCTKDGRRIPYEFVASTLEDPEGNRVLAGIGRDITDRRKYEHRLEASNERLEQFAYAASHDLQEPLRMVSSYLQLIESRYADKLDEDGREFIEFAVDGADRMRDMIDGLLEYSRVETRGDPFEPVDLDEVLADVRDDLQIRIEESDADVTADSLPRVEGDPGQLRQVFQNLIDNAIEYSGDAPPTIHVGAERYEGRSASKRGGDAAESGTEWVLSVSDEGTGIHPDDVDRVFRVFERGPDADDHEGTGIGLALCRRVVERHGGDVRIDSEPGEGTTVFFTLPAASASGE
ncbi:sensor histidine kinase [Halomicrobium urmianum]|uniref:sensor histidine kinase n=1 Tax=Halomicrobium urmianum TaxID=1586233 RepID=UPI001CD9BD21|nr:ATP-binding protein [Halomicrobium urmianum]